MDKGDLLERIKSNLPSLEVLAEPRYSKRHGSEIQGAHPIHGGTNHSDKESQNFTVNTKEQVWHCFAHDSGGDIFNWIALEEGLVDCQDAGQIHDIFSEVLRAAADRANVELDVSGKDMVELKKRQKEREKLQKGFKIAQEYFRENLKKKHRDWVKENYGFDDDTIDEYGIGFAPDNDNGLKKRLEKELGEYAYSTGLLVRAGSQYKDFFRNRITFPYKKGGKVCYFIARKTPWTPKNDYEKAKYKKQLVGKNKEYVSDQVHNHIYGLDTIRGEDQVVVTEGITDAISVLDYGIPCISPVTVQFKNDDIEKIRKLTKGKEIYVCNDADKAGFDGALSTLEEVPNSNLIELEKGDLNDFYMDNSPEAFRNKIKKSLPRCEALAKYKDDIEYLFLPALKDIAQDPQRVRSVWNHNDQKYDFYPLSAILDGIDNIKDAISVFKRTKKSHDRAPTAIERSLRKEVISGVIRRHMQKKGKFLYDDQMEDVYFFNESTHKVHNVESKEFISRTEERYGVSQSTDTGKYLFNHIYNYGVINGDHVDIHNLFYYDKKKNKLYIHNRNDHYYVLDGEDIYMEPNGENIFFKTMNKGEDSEFEYLDKGERDFPDEVIGEIDEWKGKGNMLQRIMVNRTNFTGKTALSAKQQRLQQLITLYMYPFGSRFPSKPITAYIGEKGSGKSFTMEMLGKFLLGKDYDVAGMTDEKSFMVVAYNNPLYFIDNLDKQEDWVNDALASIATGVSIKERKLYTNFETAEVKIDCFLGVNSRTPEFKRDDVVDRLLIFYVERLNENIDPEVLKEMVTENWDSLWSQYMDDLNKIVKEFSEHDVRSIKSEHRLVGWVVFAKVVSEALGLDRDEVNRLIEDMKYEKAAFSLQDDPILKPLRFFIRDEANTQKWYSARELHERLCSKSEIYEEKYNSYLSLAKRLQQIKSELNQILGMNTRWNTHENRYEYNFNRTSFVDKTKSGEENDEEKNMPDEKPSMSINKEDQTILMAIRDAINSVEGAVPKEKIVEKCKEKGLDSDEVEKELDSMRTDGKVYTPRRDKYKLA